MPTPGGATSSPPRAATTGTTIGDTWIATGFTLHDSSGSAETYPSFYWLGRNRDDPFTPTWYYNYSNGYTEGASADLYTGIFYGPSNCTCDYYGYNYWGDGSSNGAILYNYTEDYFALHGPHTYAEEGSYTTSLYGYDNCGEGAPPAIGSATVSDAALTGTPQTIYAAAGTPAAGKVVALFKDADPGGTVSDYTASINWGDGNTSAGTVGVATKGGFNVKGTHTYGAQGTFTITVTISDVGGATRTVTSHANVGPRPVVTKISPIKGTHLGGTTVTITGSGFTGATAVKFGTTLGTSLTVISGTKITVKSPAHTAGQVDVTVTTKYATSKTVAADKYTFT